MSAATGDGSGSDGLRGRVRAMLDAQWVEHGYTAPNSDVYPWQWLWDSAFHALVWAELDEPKRAVAELAAMFGPQADDGFVPHMNYALDPDASTEFWGRRGASSITQPPMYGHAVAELVRRGIEVPDDVVDAARAGLRFLLNERHRDHATDLVLLVHPWESGCDDSARWDAVLGGDFEVERWRAHKAHLVTTVELNDAGSPVANAEFRAASVGFNALVAWNLRELATTVGVDDALEQRGAELASAVGARWHDDSATWIDGGDFEASAGVRTTDALFAALVDPDASHVQAVGDQLVDPDAYGGACGPAGAHKAEPTYDPVTYWRGPAWPQMSYLLWQAMRAAGLAAAATAVASGLRRGAATSELAEYWHPDTGAPGGARPQSWAGLALMVPS